MERYGQYTDSRETLTMDNFIRIVVVLCSIQLCAAENSFYWYSSWYIWFAVTMLTTICCGVLGSYLRRRQIQKELRNQRSVILAIERTNQSQPPISAHGVGMYPPPVAPPDGAAPYRQPAPDIAFRPPAYDEVVNKETKLAALPPSYQEAIRSQGGYINQAATAEEIGERPPGNDNHPPRLNTVSATVDGPSYQSPSPGAGLQRITDKTRPERGVAHPSGDNGQRDTGRR